MSNPTELNGKTEDGYTPLVDLEDDGDEEFDDGYIPPNIHPFKRFLLRARNRCTLPRPVDNTGRRKNIIQRAEYVSLVIAFFGLLTFFSSWNATHPIVSIETTMHSALELPMLQVCFPSGFFPGVALEAAIDRVKLGYYCEGDNFENRFAEACNTMIRFNRSLSANCVTFGAHDEAPWIFNGTTERAELLIFLASYTLAKYSRPFSFVEMNWVNNFNEPFPNSTIYITRPSGYNNLDIRKEVEIDAVGHKFEKYPTDIHFMPLQPEEVDHLCLQFNCTRLGESGILVDYLVLAVRVHTTRVTIIQDETATGLLLRILTDLGSIMSLVSVLFGFIFGTFITRAVFTRRDAFFDTDARLAITYFKSMQKRNNSFVNLRQALERDLPKYTPPANHVN